MRIGIIGFGRAGRVHLEAWRAVPGVEIAAVSDPSPAIVAAARAEGLHAVAASSELLGMPGLDAVSICAPPVEHAPLAIAALEQGLDVLCEKPLAIRGPAAMRMMQTAARTGRNLLLATKFRHVPDLLVARELVAGGAIGEPLAFEIDFSSRVDMAGRWNARRSVSGGGVIIDNGCHAFDIVGFLFGPVTRVQATRLRPAQALTVEDSATVMVEVTKGLIGRIDLSWSHATQRETYLMIHGTEGSIDIGWRQSRVRRIGEEPRPLHVGLYDKHASHVAMMNAFLAVVSGTPPPVDLAGRMPAHRRGGRSLVPLAALGGLGSGGHDGRVRCSGPAEGARVSGAGDAPRIHPTALVEDGVRIGPRTPVWDNVHLRGPSTIGHDCIIGEKTYIAYGVEIGNFVKINAMVYVPTGAHDRGSRDDRRRRDLHQRPLPARVRRWRRGARRRPARPRTPLCGHVAEGATIGAGARIGPGVDGRRLRHGRHGRGRHDRRARPRPGDGESGAHPWLGVHLRAAAPERDARRVAALRALWPTLRLVGRSGRPDGALP